MSKLKEKINNLLDTIDRVEESKDAKNSVQVNESVFLGNDENTSEEENENELSEEFGDFGKLFEELYSSLDESHKSHIISVLLGKGLIKKKDDGKFTKAPKSEVNKIIKK